jgi:hypothetical protein
MNFIIYQSYFQYDCYNAPFEVVNTPGGTTETEIRKISGPEITRPEFTPVNAALMEIVSILR